MDDATTALAAPADGIRLGGKTYDSGQIVPAKYRRQVEESTRPRDPASRVAGAAPNLGRAIMPHVITFSGLLTTLSKAYRYHDEALNHSVENAHMMLNDPVIAGPVFARQRMASLLKWSIESEDDKDKTLKAACEKLTAIFERTPYFTEYRRSLSEAIWYGRYAIQNQYGTRKDRFGNKSIFVKKWTPISGDKLKFRYDDGSGEFDPDGIGVRISPAIGKPDAIAGHRQIESTSDGLAYFFEGWERRGIALHRHMIRDGEYESPLSAGQIHGVGLRHFIYWTWYQKQETMSQMMEIIERTGKGIRIYYYPSGNDQAKQEVAKIAEEEGHTNRFLFPYDRTDPNAPTIQEFPPNTAGVEILKQIVDDYFGDQVARFILGQTLSTKASGTGLGSGVADLHQDSLQQIIRYDSIGLQESITRDFLIPLRDYNFPHLRNVDFFFRISAESKVPQEELDAIRSIWEMGGKIRQEDVFGKVGLAIPQPDDEILQNPQIAFGLQQMEQAEQQQQVGSLGAGFGDDTDGDPGGLPDDENAEQPNEQPNEQPQGEAVFDDDEALPMQRDGDREFGPAVGYARRAKSMPGQTDLFGAPTPKAAEQLPGIDPTNEPKEGDRRKNRAGNEEVLRGGRWHLVSDPVESPESHTPGKQTVLQSSRWGQIHKDITGFLKENGPAGIQEIANKTGYHGLISLTNISELPPLNQALKELRDGGHILELESRSREPRFTIGDGISGEFGLGEQQVAHEDVRYFKGDAGKVIRQEEKHGAMWDVLEMLEGPHAGQKKLVPTAEQKSEDVGRQKTERKEMQEGFTRLREAGPATGGNPSTDLFGNPIESPSPQPKPAEFDTHSGKQAKMRDFMGDDPSQRNFLEEGAAAVENKPGTPEWAEVPGSKKKDDDADHRSDQQKAFDHTYDVQRFVSENPHEANATALTIARGNLLRQISHLQRKAERGEMSQADAASQIDGLQSEADWYNEIWKSLPDDEKWPDESEKRRQVEENDRRIAEEKAASVRKPDQPKTASPQAEHYLDVDDGDLVDDFDVLSHSDLTAIANGMEIDDEWQNRQSVIEAIRRETGSIPRKYARRYAEWYDNPHRKAGFNAEKGTLTPLKNLGEQSGSETSTGADDPKEGDTRENRAGNTEFLKGGRWHLQNPHETSPRDPGKQESPPEQQPEAESIDIRPLKLDAHFDSMPDGTEIDGWKKETTSLGDFWVKGNEALASSQMVDRVDPDSLCSAMGGPKGGDGSSGGPGDGSDPSDEDHSSADQDSINAAAAMFGMGEGREAAQFVKRAAKTIGWKGDHAGSAAEYLHGQAKGLHATIDIAKAYGHKPGSGGLLKRSREAAKHIVNRATRSGFEARSENPRDDLAGALTHLSRESQRDGGAQHADFNGITSMLSGLAGGSPIARFIAGAVIGFMAVKAMQRGKRQLMNYLGGSIR